MEKDNRVKSDGNTALSNDISDNAVLEQGSRNTRKQVIVVASLLSFLLPATQYSRYQYYCPTARISIYLCCWKPQNKTAQCCETVTIFLSFRLRLSTSSFWQVPVPVRQHCQYPPDFIIPDHRGLSLGAKSPVMFNVRSLPIAQHAFQAADAEDKWMRINAFATIKRMLNPENKLCGSHGSVRLQFKNEYRISHFGQTRMRNKETQKMRMNARERCKHV